MEVTIDHVVPESISTDNSRLQAVLQEYDLPPDFKVHGYENWLPAHAHCNASKASAVFRMVPAYRPIFDQLLRKADAVSRTVDAISRNRKTDKLLANLLAALDSEALSARDLCDILTSYGLLVTLGVEAEKTGKYIRMENGYLLPREEVAIEGYCSCERDACVGHQQKLYCYWSVRLSPWVRGKRLYQRCYDEAISCPRCRTQHQRGHIGLLHHCKLPYQDQEAQQDHPT